MKIKNSIVQDWLDSISKKQKDNIRFLPIVINTRILEGEIEFTITTENEVLGPQTVTVSVGDRVTIPNCYLSIELDT